MFNSAFRVVCNDLCYHNNDTDYNLPLKSGWLLSLDYMWTYACKQKNNLAVQFPQNMYLVWTGYITSSGWHETPLWLSHRPFRWHPQHMWHDLLQHRYTGAPSRCANSRQGPQMCVAPLGHGGRMRCPSLFGSADAPHNCQAFSFIRPGSDTYRGVQPRAIIAASLRCTLARAHTVTFGIISKRSQFHQWKDVTARDLFLQFCVLNACRGGEIMPQWHE